ncbi:MAG TPA: F0F1 ATP synthase subunit B [Bacteroidetes bacterium]|nr:F0F1 ATP synthase subunit B [Bacteroidota bacterium]HIL57064.1 ATP synthase F0 subunit B [Rhodothermales bacterium]
MSLLLAANLLAPNAGLVFWLALAFTLLLILLGKFAWPAIIGGIEEREQRIETSLNEADRALAEAKQLQADNDAARREAERQAQTILRDAREEAEAIRTADVEKTRAELAEMRESARADIEREKRQALAELRSEVAALAVSGAEKILKKEIDPAAQSALVDDFITELPQN